MDILSDVSVSGKLTAETLKVNDEIETKIVRLTSDSFYGERSLQVNGTSIFNGPAEFCFPTYFSGGVSFCQDVDFCRDVSFQSCQFVVDSHNISINNNNCFTINGYEQTDVKIESKSFRITTSEFVIDPYSIRISHGKIAEYETTGSNIPIKSNIEIDVPQSCSKFFIIENSHFYSKLSLSDQGIFPVITAWTCVNEKMKKIDIDYEACYCIGGFDDSGFYVGDHVSIIGEIEPQSSNMRLFFGIVI